MSDDFLLEQIAKNPIVQQYKDLFRELSGLQIEIRRIDGTPLTPVFKSNTPHLKRNILCQTCPNTAANCLRIKQEVLDQLQETQEPQVYLCPAGLRKIVVPLIISQRMVGILFTGENATLRFNGIQSTTISQLLRQLMNYIIKNELNPLNMSLGSSLTRQQEILNKVIRYIKENFQCNQLTLQEVAIKSGISYHYLSRLFVKELKTTFAQFRNKIRMEAATNLLKDRRLSVSQVSFACGFEDPAYFCKVFRGTFGSSPISFRNKRPSPKSHELRPLKVKKIQEIRK